MNKIIYFILFFILTNCGMCQTDTEKFFLHGNESVFTQRGVDISEEKVIDELVTEFIKELKPSLEEFLADYPIDTIEKIRLDDLLEPAFEALHGLPHYPF